jgi:hypothetical protein
MIAIEWMIVSFAGCSPQALDAADGADVRIRRFGRLHRVDRTAWRTGQRQPSREGFGT